MTKVQSQDIDNKAFLTTGTAPAFEVTIPRETAYADMDRQKITINLHASASAAITINVNGLGAKSLVDNTGAAITTATADDYLDLIYDLSQDVFVGSAIGVAGGSGAGGAAGIISETFTTAVNLTTETLTVTHNLGYTPTAIELNSLLQSESGDLFYSPVPESKGYYLNGIQKNISKVWNNSSPDAIKWYAYLHANIGYLKYSPSSSTDAYMNMNINIINITSTTFDIEISKTGGTAYSVVINFFGLIIK